MLRSPKKQRHSPAWVGRAEVHSDTKGFSHTDGESESCDSLIFVAENML